jgi:hypothetical protein
MGFRFRKSVKILPGVRLNLSKSGLSTSIGGPGATVNLGGKGTRHTVGLPGSGLSFSSFTPKNQPESASDGARINSPSNIQTGCGCLVLALLAILAVGMCSNRDAATHDSTLPPASGHATKFDVGDSVYVTASNLNGRSVPSTAGRIVGHFRSGEAVQVVDRSGEWLKIIQNGTALWIVASHVSATNPHQLKPQTLLKSRTDEPPIHTRSRARPERHAFFGKVCKRGKPCGNACIARSRVCHK